MSFTLLLLLAYALFLINEHKEIRSIVNFLKINCDLRVLLGLCSLLDYLFKQCAALELFIIGIYFSAGTRPQVCNPCYCFSLWYGMVLGGCAVSWDDLRELPLSSVQHPSGRDRGRCWFHEEVRQEEEWWNHTNTTGLPITYTFLKFIEKDTDFT